MSPPAPAQPLWGRRAFCKMHGLGNDFVVIDATREPFRPSPALLRALADRHLGVGCDQILVVEPATSAQARFAYRIYNADGSEVAQCGNGARCFARFVHEQGLTDLADIPVETRAGLMTLHLQSAGRVRVNLGCPRFDPAAIPIAASQSLPRYVLGHEGAVLEFGAVSLGNPHAVLQVADVAAADVIGIGGAWQAHPFFPQRVNVGFMQVLGPDAISLRVFERGAGETRACGSGAAAAVVVGRLWGLLAEQVTVHLPGGDLEVRWSGLPEDPVWQIGPAVTVFRGEVDLDALLAGAAG